MKSFKTALSVLMLIPTLSQAQSLAVRDNVTRPEKSSNSEPSYRLGVYKMGGRPQRVRVFMTDEKVGNSYVVDGARGETASPQLDQLYTDPLAAGKFSCIGVDCNYQTSATIDVAFNKPYDKAVLWGGFILNPHVMLCAAKAIEQAKRVMDANPSDTNLMQIDEVNIIINAINGQPEEHDRELSRGDVAAIKNDPALNYSIPLIVGSDGNAKCGVVSDDTFKTAWAKLVAKAKE